MKARDIPAPISVAVVWSPSCIAIEIGVGMIAGSLVFGEPLGPFELWGALLVMAGLGFNVFGDRRLRRWLRCFG